MAKDKKKKKDKAGKSRDLAAKRRRSASASKTWRTIGWSPTSSLQRWSRQPPRSRTRRRRRPSRRAPAIELEHLAKEGAERGNAMWKLALEVGRRAIDTIAGDEAKPATKSKSKAKAKGKAAKPVSK